jgi:hypothetical protein
MHVPRQTIKYRLETRGFESVAEQGIATGSRPLSEPQSQFAEPSRFEKFANVYVFSTPIGFTDGYFWFGKAMVS